MNVRLLLGLSALAAGCIPPGTDAPEDTADTGDSGDTEDSGAEEIDLDGDGAPDWHTARDPADADCDDSDPAVGPTTERFVPAGPFTRGREGDPLATPVRTITLSAYCIDRTEVTNAAFVELLALRDAEGSTNADDDGNPLYDVWDDDDDIPERIVAAGDTWEIESGYADHPVVEVWWTGAAYYCARQGRALPTEAQWEKAARGADDTRAFPWGDETPSCAHANFVDAPVGSPPQDWPACVGDTTAAGSYPDAASPYGVVDLAGNVSEWVADWFDAEGYTDDPDTDPTGPDEGMEYDDGVGSYVARLARGGNFQLGPEYLEVGMREPEPEGATSNGLGFRCARPLE